MKMIDEKDISDIYSSNSIQVLLDGIEKINQEILDIDNMWQGSGGSHYYTDWLGTENQKIKKKLNKIRENILTNGG